MNLAQRQFQELSKIATVKICTEEDYLLGTGFFVLPNQILTCYHVIRNRENILLYYKNGSIVNPDGNENINVIHRAPDKDLVLIELKENIVDSNQFCLMLSNRVQMGDDCYSFGFSKELFNSDTVLTKYVDQVGDSKEWIKLKDDRIINGFSGSGLINLKSGQVVGVVSESLSTSLNLGGLAISTDIIFGEFPDLKNRQEQFFELQLHFAKIYKRLLFDYETIEGVDIIDNLFIEFHRHKEHTSFTPRDFYLATPITQWWGIINNLTIDKKVFPKIIDFIRNNFNHSAPIISLLYGSGGMGKSTTARKLLYHFKNQYKCIWIDDLLEEDDGGKFFNDFLPRMTVDHRKTLIVLDDWGKLPDMLKGKFKRLFKINYKKSITNIKFVITGRQQQIKDILLEWQVPNAKIFFNVAAELQIDNEKLLNKFLESFSIKQDSFLSTKTQLIGLKPFHLLFTLIRAIENEAIEKELAKTTSYGNYFQDIINFDLNELYKDKEKRGFVYALIFSAYLSNQHNFNISKSTFLQIVDKYNNAPYSLLKNKINSPTFNWKVLRFYISEYTSRKNKRINASEQIQFNKDDFKEAILKVDLDHCSQSALEFFDLWKKELLEEIIDNGSIYSSSIIGFVFSGLEKVLDDKIVIENLLEKETSHHSYTKLFLDDKFCDLSFNEKWSYINSFLKFATTNSYTNALISSVIRKEFKKDKQHQNTLFKSLLERGAKDQQFVNGFLNTISEPETAIKEAKALIHKSDSFEVICNCLKILEGEPETAIKEAKALIHKSDSFAVICNCLKILEGEPETIEIAKALIHKSDSFAVICNCLKILEGEPETIEIAKALIHKSDNYQVICNCLKILEGEPETIEIAKALIHKSDSFEVICNCLKILEGEPETIEIAKALIHKSDNYQVICNCLKILEGEPETIEIAKALIHKSDNHQVICYCLKILEAEPEGQFFALSAIKHWKNSDRNVIIRSLNCVPHYKEAQQLISKIILKEIQDYYLYIQVIKHCHDKYPRIQKFTREILKNWKGNSLQIVGICLKHYEYNLALTKPICQDIIVNWKTILTRMKKIKRANIQFFLKSMAHPELKELIGQKSNEMLSYEKSNYGFLPKKIKDRCLLITEKNEFQEWIYKEDSASNNI